MINFQRAQLFYYCKEDTLAPVESFIDEHKLCYILSGSLNVYHEGKLSTYKKGDVILFKRNQLVRATLVPEKNGTSFSSFKIVFAQEFLLKFQSTHTDLFSAKKTKENYHKKANPLLSSNNEMVVSFFKSLSPYLNADNTITKELSDNKTREILLILEMLWPGIGNYLFDFEAPGKIDIEKFMQKNFANNVPLTKLAYLTGRSLTSFKRDFIKVFGLPPHKWLMQRRLTESMELIKKEKQSPSEIYLKIGFESLAHFSTAFKKMFGYPPTSISHKRDEQQDF